MRLVAGETEAAKLGAHLARLGAGQQALHVLKRRLVRHELLDLMLGKIADAQFAASNERAAHRLELAGEEPSQRGLAIAVAADERDAVVGIDAQIEARQDGCALRIADRGVIEHDQRWPQLLRTRKVEHDRRILARRRDRLKLGQRFQAALRLARGVRLVAPAIDIGLQLLGLRFLRGARGFRLRLTLATQLDEGVIVAGIERQSCRD